MAKFHAKNIWLQLLQNRTNGYRRSILELAKLYSSWNSEWA